MHFSDRQKLLSQAGECLCLFPVALPAASLGVMWCLADNWPTVEPYFNETGSNCPSILP